MVTSQPPPPPPLPVEVGKKKWWRLDRASLPPSRSSMGGSDGDNDSIATADTGDTGAPSLTSPLMITSSPSSSPHSASTPKDQMREIVVMRRARSRRMSEIQREEDEKKKKKGDAE